MYVERHPVPDTCDICVVGAGAAGACVAHRLAQERDIRTVVLESGVWRDSADWDAENDNDEVYQRLRSVNRAARPGEESSSVDFKGNGQYENSRIGQTFGVVGGYTVVYAATSWRFRREDFQKRTLYQKRLEALCEEHKWPLPSLLDWPGGDFYRELEPYYCEAERLTGVSGDWDADPATRAPEPGRLFRSRETYLPALPYHRINEMLAQGARKLGYRPFPIPLGISSVENPVNGLRPCVSCNYCSGYPCVWDAKGSVDVAILLPLRRQAERAAQPHLTIHSGVTVCRVLFDDNGRCTGVEYKATKNPTGETRRIRCKAVVLAAGAVLSPRLLLHSERSRRMRYGTQAIGKYLTFHADEKREALFPDVFEADPVMVKKLAVMDHYLPTPAEKFINHCSIQTATKSGPIAFASRRLVNEPVQDAPWGEAFQAGLKDYPRFYEIQTIVEDLPMDTNRVELDEREDAFGVPRPKITHQFHKMDVEAVERTLDHMEEILRAAGGTVVGSRPAAPPRPNGSHLMGTVRMGSDPATSAADPDCRLHGVPNLFVPDGSAFPTSAGLNPGLTVEANALRVADRLLSLYRDGRI
jgi:choline dehydrogenase-like flavoprotein